MDDKTQLDIFIALWKTLINDLDCTLESSTGLTIYIDADESEKDFIVEKMHLHGANGFRLDWCNGNWTVTAPRT